jgi:hypothetical protein
MPKCPKCGNYRFSHPAQAHPDTQITCLDPDFGQVSTVEEAFKAGIAPTQLGDGENPVDQEGHKLWQAGRAEAPRSIQSFWVAS